MVKILIAAGIFLIVCIVAVINSAYERGWSAGYCEGLNVSEEIRKKEGDANNE